MYSLTDKSKNLIETKKVGGTLYALMGRNNDKEVWLKVAIPKIPKCPICGYSGYSMEKHHLYGRKFSNKKIEICVNCHREIHAGTRNLNG